MNRYVRFVGLTVIVIGVVMIVLSSEQTKIMAPSVGPRLQSESQSVTDTPQRLSRKNVVSSGGVDSLTQRAYAGDARAQWKLSERLHSCSLALALAERIGPSAESTECENAGIVRNNEWQMWRDKAIEAGDPMALLFDALQSGDPEQSAIAADAAARSGDPEAQVLLGHMLLAEDPLDGLAWMIVGCGDCLMEDPRLGFVGCVEAGSCPSNTRFMDYIAAEYGHGVVQEAQARAASLTELYR